VDATLKVVLLEVAEASPANTWVLMTTSSPSKSLAFCAASSGEKATAIFGMATPKSWNTPSDWYSCKLRFRRPAAANAKREERAPAARRASGATANMAAEGGRKGG